MLVNFLPLEDMVNMSYLASSPSGSGHQTLTTSNVEEAEEALLGRGSVALCGPSACPEAVSDDDSPVDVERDRVPLTGLGPVNSEERTIDWITRLSTPALSETSGDDVTSLTYDSQTSAVLPASALTDQAETVVEGVRRAVPALDAVTMTDTTPDSKTAGQSSNALCSHAGARSRVRSRFGRFVNPVNRLIQTMSRQDVVQDKFDVKAVCKSVFQALTNSGSGCAPMFFSDVMV